MQDEPVAPSAGAVEAEPDAEGESEAADDAAPKKTSGSRFKDPTDGMFDLTLNFSKGGFVPIPFLITEPASGFGGGAAALFIHERNVEDTSAVNAPPNATVVMGAGTENGPGPLVSHLVGKLAGDLPVPVTVVPGGLRRDEVIALA